MKNPIGNPSYVDIHMKDNLSHVILTYDEYSYLNIYGVSVRQVNSNLVVKCKYHEPIGLNIVKNI